LSLYVFLSFAVSHGVSHCLCMSVSLSGCFHVFLTLSVSVSLGLYLCLCQRCTLGAPWCIGISVFWIIRIRDPNRGGRDITEEIMSGGRSATTPTPPQRAAERDVSPLAEPDVTKEAPLVSDKSSSRTIKATPPGVVKDTLTSVVKETPTPGKESVPVVAKESTNPVVKAVASTVVKEAPAPVVKETPTHVFKEDPAPVVKTAPAPVAKVELATVAKETSAPPAKEEPASVAREAPIPDVKEAPVPVVKEASVPVVKVASVPVVKEMPPPPVVAKEPPAPVVKETSIAMETPVVKETPLPVATQTTEPLLKDPHAPVLKEPSPAAKETPKSVVKETSAPVETVSDAAKATSLSSEEREDTPPPQTTAPEITMQGKFFAILTHILCPFYNPCPLYFHIYSTAISVPKKKRKIKDLNKKETGDLLDAFKEPTPPQPEATPPAKPEWEEPTPVAPPPVEEVDETWEEKEDKLDAENIQPQEQWKPLNPEEKKKYDREFLLGFQFISASMNKPEGLPHISDVVLDKANKTPLRPLDPSRLPGMNCGPDFTPSFANLGRQPAGGGRGPPPGMGGPRRSAQGSRKEPRKIIATVSLSDDVQLNKAEKAWKPTLKRAGRAEDDDPETIRTQELFRRVRSILNKLTPQMFQSLMKQVTELTIDTEERLKGVIDLIFEKAISEPNFSVAYANMCRCLMGLKVPTTDKPGVTVNFRKLLLNRCQKEFEKDKDDDEIFEKKQKELDAATGEEKQRLKEELEEAKDKARRRSLGNIKFIGELFKLKMLTENIMHDCIVKLLKNHDEESLECLCRLLSTIGKDLDFEKAKPRMDQYFHQMEKIIKERKTSSRIRFMLQDLIDLRRCNWVPRRGDQGPKTIEQIHKEAELEEHREQVKVQQQLLSKKDGRGSGGMGSRGGPHTPGPRDRQGPDEGWNTVPISTKNRTIDASRLSKITKPAAMDFNNQLLAPGGKGTWGSWGKGSSGGTGAKPIEAGKFWLSVFMLISVFQGSQNVSMLSSSRERGDRFERRDDRGPDRLDRNRPAVTKRSFSREKDERGGERERAAEAVRRVASMTDEREPAQTPPPAPSKPALSPEELEKKSTAIIEEYLHINDLKEALQCVVELNCAALLCIFVRTGIESTLERSTIAREHLGLLFHQLIKAGTLSTQQYYKGLMEVLEVAEDMAIDIPHIWVYLAELITPMLHEGGIPMGSLFREVAKPLTPIDKAGDLLAQILNLLCKGMSDKKVGTMWRESGLSWKDFLPEDQDVNKFVTDKGVEYTLGEECVKSSGSSRKSLSTEEISKQLDVLLQDKADNQQIYDWVEANLDEQQMSSNTFVRALMTSVCQNAIICENPYKVDAKEISQRAKLLQRYIKDEQKELQALYALQGLMVQMEQPPNLLRMFFDVLYDEDVIKEEGFYKWESSKDPAEQQGKGVALKSVTAFFTWLREAEDESDNS
uniref:Eukaryotic translation initiation factor 4 gamma 1 n=1 Tax=Astyanax mexicanus TaxID=7994 RepID=A0A8B9RE72_ASTMX